MRIIPSLLSLTAAAILLSGASDGSAARATTVSADGCHVCYERPGGETHRCSTYECTIGSDDRCVENCDHGSADGSGSCFSYRSCGIVDLVESGDLERAIKAEDASALRVMLAQSDRITFNAQRGLVQVLNCTGAVVQQHPLTPQTRIALAEE